MGAMNLKSLIDITVNLGKFTLTRKYNQFLLEIFDEAQCNTEFRLAERDIPRLSDALQLPHKLQLPRNSCK